MPTRHFRIRLLCCRWLAPPPRHLPVPAAQPAAHASRSRSGLPRPAPAGAQRPRLLPASLSTAPCALGTVVLQPCAESTALHLVSCRLLHELPFVAGISPSATYSLPGRMALHACCRAAFPFMPAKTYNAAPRQASPAKTAPNMHPSRHSCFAHATLFMAPGGRLAHSTSSSKAAAGPTCFADRATLGRPTAGGRAFPFAAALHAAGVLPDLIPLFQP